MAVCQQCAFTGCLERHACPRCHEIVSVGVPTEDEIEAAAAAIKAANLAKMADRSYVPPGERTAKHRLSKAARKGSTVGTI